MGTGGAAARTHQRNRLTARDGLTDRDQVLLVMAIARHEAVAMAPFDRSAIPGAIAGIRDDARGHRHDFASIGSSEIHTFMEGLVARERVLTLAEVRGN